MVREALFSILGNAVPQRPFYDVFAGTGANGLEALSRGASFVYFVERDFRLAQAIDNHLREFEVVKEAQVIRTDVYRWAGQWQPPAEPVNIFVSPPFADFERRSEEMLALKTTLERKVANDSVLVIQTERKAGQELWAEFAGWEERRYGRNVLLLWVKDSQQEQEAAP
jgi:16S rRNA (guanine966-N2)-methyltransferase